MMSPEDQISAIIRAAFDEAGPLVVQGIQNEISDAYPPSSEPATPPHLRTGNLQGGISFSVDEFWDGVTLMIASAAEYSAYLRDGTGIMAARDFFGAEMQERYTSVVIAALRGRFGPPPSAGLDVGMLELAGIFGIEWDPTGIAA